MNAKANHLSRRISGIMLAGLLVSAAQLGWTDTYYVTTNGVGDGSSWAQATNSIQGAIDRALVAGDVVLVSNGVYETDATAGWPSGTLLPSRIVIPRAITVRSASGDPSQAVIRGRRASSGQTNGADAVRCAYLAVAGASLIGFTLTNGATLASGTNADQYGGGAYCNSGGAILSNCIVTACSAKKKGGGVYNGRILGSTIRGGTALYGAGADNSVVSNCTVTGNLAAYNGGGTYQATVFHSIISGNEALQGAGGTYAGHIYDSMIISNSSPPSAAAPRPARFTGAC